MATTTTTLVVPADSPLLGGETETLHTYDNGDVLVRVTGPIPESTAHVEVGGGVQLAGVPEATLEHARRAGAEDIGIDDVSVAYVELAGPPEGSVVRQLEELGLRLITFSPPSAYLCRGTGQQFRAVAQLPFVTNVIRQGREIKPQPMVSESGADELWAVLYTVLAETTLSTLEEIDGLAVTGQLHPATGPYSRVAVRATAAAAAASLELPGVAALEPVVAARPEDEVADLVIAGMLDSQNRPVGKYLTWLQDHDIDGSGTTIGIVDAGIDGTHEAFTGRIVIDDPTRRDWHGTFVAGHAAGDYRTEKDPNGYIYGVGMAPGADLLSQDMQGAAESLCGDTVQTAGVKGRANGSIQNNSWGAGTQPAGMDYRSQEALYDQLVRNADGNGTPLTVCFSAGNSGSSGLTRPKAAKNAIVTGNSESYRPEFATDKPTDALHADNVNEVYTGPHASSYGNCADGRIRPHVVAPGEWTSAANFDSHPGQAEYISPELTWGGGTSGASPKTAGACALLTQWWTGNIAGTGPSPAMLRAMVVNGAKDTGFGGPIPNSRQGWGRLDLGTVLDESVHKTYLDQTVLLTANGQEKTWNMQVSDPTKPVRITLAWTDAPGAIGSGTATATAMVNRLGIEVNVVGTNYYGNEFMNGWSRSSARPQLEGMDNVQNVYLPGGTVSGRFTVTVRAVALAMNALTGAVTDPRQDFALVIHNGHQDQSFTPFDMSLVIDDNQGGGTHDHWDDGSSDGDLDGDDTWGDGSERPTLRRGDTGDDVRDLQQALTDLGYDTNGIDGKFGPGTRQAVISFQRDQGLTADGVVGELTWRALVAAAAGSPGSGTGTGGGLDTAHRPTLRSGDRGDDVRDLQQALTDLGYDTNGIDGKFGPGTRQAVISFQRDQGLTADGVVGPQTWAALGSPSAGGGADDGWFDWDSWTPETARDFPTIATEVLAEAAAQALEELDEEHIRLALPAAADSARTESRSAPATAGRDRIITQAAGSLRPALQRLESDWQIADDDDGALMRPKVAVLLIGGGSRFAVADLVIMRRLAHRGEVYVVSDSAEVLDWLAQRLQLRCGVHYRRILSQDHAREALANVAVEACGALRAIVPQRQFGTGASAVTQSQLHLTERDHKAVVVVRTEGTAEVSVGAPDAELRPLTERSRRQGLELQEVSPGLARITLRRRAAGPWAGMWRVEVKDPHALVSAHVFGDTQIMVTSKAAAPETSPATESGAASQQEVTVTAQEDRLVSVRIDPVERTESSRQRLELRPTPSRLAAEAATATEALRDEPSSEALGGSIPMPAGSHAVLDLTVDVHGRSPEGRRFYRSGHQNIVTVHSRSEWRRKRGRARSPEELVPARVSEVLLEEGSAMMGLVLVTGSRRRAVRVEDATLRELLIDVDLSGRNLLFGLNGDVVRSVVDPLDAS